MTRKGDGSFPILYWKLAERRGRERETEKRKYG
jgi:hypothetical protein